LGTATVNAQTYNSLSEYEVKIKELGDGGKIKEAVALAKEAIDNGYKIEVIYNLTLTHYHFIEDSEGGLKLARKALLDYPKSYYFTRSIEVYAEKLNNDDFSIFKVIYKFSSDFPDNKSLTTSAGKAAELAWQKTDAIICYKRVLRLDPNNENAKERLEALRNKEDHDYEYNGGYE
jgi:tetratricopeptide (TPR) repeat protein